MKPALSIATAVLAAALSAGAAEAAQPSKKDIANCAGQDVAVIIKGCTALIDKSPKNPRARILGLYNRGLAHYRAGDYGKALGDHDAAIDLFVKNKIRDRNIEYNLYLNRGRTKYSQKDWRGSAADSEAATKVDTINPQAYTNWSFALLELEEYEEARRHLDWAIAVKPDEPTSRGLRGLIKFYLGRYDESLGDYNEAIRLAPDTQWARSNRALYYWWTSNSNGALADLGTVLAAEPKNVWARTMRARILTQRSDFAAAQADLDAAFAGNPDFPVAHMVQGKIFRGTGRLAEARAALEKSLTLDATLIESLTTLAEMAAAGKDYAAALAYYDRAGRVAVKTDQDRSRRADAEAARGKLVDLMNRPAKLAAACDNTRDIKASREACTELLAMTGDPLARLPLLHKRLATSRLDGERDADLAAILAIAPRDVTALIGRAARRQEGHDYQGAIADLSTALEIEPRNLAALAGRARNFRALKNPSASADIAAILAIDPANIAGRILQIEESAGAKTWRKLGEDATAFSLAHPDLAFGWLYRAQAKYELGDLVGAFADATRAIELDTKSPTAQVIRGKIFASQGRHDDAANAYSRALALVPDDEVILALRAASYLALGNGPFAKSDAEAIVARDLHSETGRILRAKASFLNGEYGGALADSADVLRNSPDNEEMLLLRAEIRLAQKDFTAAIRETDAAIAVASGNARAWLMRATAKSAQGDMAGALADLSEAARLDPEMREIYPLRAGVQLALGNADAALADAVTALKADPRNLTALIVSGEAHLRRGETVLAVEALEAAARIDARSVSPLKLMGDAYAKIGSNDLALQFYARAIEQSPADDIAAAAREDARRARAALMDKMAKAAAP